jgi:DNA invertase Pin-like site-specific DNA recombinase/transposase-like protein
MTEATKITARHLRHCAFVYVRQSSAAQVTQNRESTARQYQLVERAVALGWSHDQVNLIDEDLGISGSGLAERSGFAHMIAEVALGNAGIVLALEASRLARNNADWYRLLDLCAVTDTLIGDADGLYHPGLFNDRLVLGLKGTMSEAELHVLRARLNGGIRNKAARGELRRGLPVGFIWGDGEGEVRFHPDQSVVDAIRAVFERFAEMGSARRVWLHFRSERLRFPSQRFPSLAAKNALEGIEWVTPTYTKIHQVLTSPVYAGAYVYGKSRHERFVDTDGKFRTRVRRLPRSEWGVLLREHHEGFIDWNTFEANQMRLGSNTRPRPHEPAGVVREGTALLQGIATCGRCGRGLHVAYSGRTSSPSYFCPGKDIVNGRGEFCLRIGGRQIDDAVVPALLAVLSPAALEASLEVADLLSADRETALNHWRQQLERARYEAQRAERRYRAVDAENRLVARGLEAEWEKSLRELADAEAELARRECSMPNVISQAQRQAILALGIDVERVWSATTTTDRDRKELLRTVLEEVIIAVEREEGRAHLALRWRGGLITDVDVSLPPRQAPVRTEEETIDLVRRLALHYPDAVIAGILNRQGRLTATGLRFTANRVSSLRTHWSIPCHERRPAEPSGELVSVYEAAQILDVAPSTLFRWLNDGFIAGEQLTPGAPWRIRMTDDLRARFVEEPPPGFVPMVDAMRLLGVSRQTVLHRVKCGELQAVHVRRGRRKGLTVKVPASLAGLFDVEESVRG